MPSPALFNPLPINALSSTLAANVPNKIEINPPFCYFAFFHYFISNPDSSSDLTIFISSISSFQIINAVIREAKSEGQPDP